MATAYFQSTGAGFKQAILCHPEPLEIQSHGTVYHFVASFEKLLLQEKLWATLHCWETEGCFLSSSFMAAGPPALRCSVSPKGAGEHRGEMSSSSKLGQYVKSDGDLNEP